MRPYALLAIALIAPACSSNGLDQVQMPDASTPPDLTQLPDLTQPFPAPHPSPPQVVSGGGKVLAAPTIVQVFFSNDDPQMTMQITDFGNKVGATAYWKAVTEEYGVGAASAVPPVQLAEAANGTIDDSTIQTWLAAKLNGNDPAFPAAVKNPIYVLHYPAGVTITLTDFSGTSQSCQSFGGYHGDIALDAQHGRANVSYAVIPRCSDFGGLTGIDAVTATESHELIEAATDPFPNADPAYGQVDDDHLYWMFVLGGGETGDMCAQEASSFTTFSELPYVVQRSWSNASAAAGHDPCVPELPNEVYFNAAPEVSDSISIGGQYVMTGVKVPVGSSKTIDLDLFSDGDVGGTWNLQALDAASLMGGQPSLELTLDRASGRNGDKLRLTIHTLRATQYNAGVFMIVSKHGQDSHYWFGLVGE